MSTPKETEVVRAVSEEQSNVSRRSFVKGASFVGAAGLVGLGGLLNLASARPKRFDKDEDRDRDHDRDDDDPKRRDKDILIAAEIAEALAVTTYSNIIDNSPFFGRLQDDDQGYLRAALNEEMSHYLLEQSVTNEPSPFSFFFYPPNMFKDAQTTLNVLVTLEDAFIAAYLVGVRNFSTPELRVTSARIMGIESDHRTLARVVGPGVSTIDHGPIENITGFAGVPESVDPPNNNGYERTLCWTRIEQAIQALTPFVDAKAAGAAGFDAATSFAFKPFTPTLPSALGEFISFKGC